MDKRPNFNHLHSNPRYKAAPELIEGLLIKRFNGTHAGITNRELFHWFEKGLVYYQPEERKLRRFNFIEFIWLRMMVKMRSFGIDLDTIKRVKHFVIDSSPIKGFAAPSNLSKLFEKGFTRKKTLTMEEFSFSAERKPAPPPLFFWVISSILKKGNVCILIGEKGEIDLLDETSVNYHYRQRSLHQFFNSSFLSVSLTEIICRFVKDNDVTTIKQLGLLSHDELKLLELVRADFIESCDFFTVDEKTISTRIGADLNLEEISSGFIDALFRSRYKKIVFRTKENHEVQFENQRGKHLVIESDPGIDSNP